MSKEKYEMQNKLNWWKINNTTSLLECGIFYLGGVCFFIWNLNRPKLGWILNRSEYLNLNNMFIFSSESRKISIKLFVFLT